jgi:hypothetical protein
MSETQSLFDVLVDIEYVVENPSSMLENLINCQAIKAAFIPEIHPINRPKSNLFINQTSNHSNCSPIQEVGA